MGTKNLGPGVSGYLDVAGRAWSLPVFQAGKPVLDRELNLGDDLAGQGQQALIADLLGSGFLADGTFLETTAWGDAILIPSTVANELKLRALRAVVNGWTINLANTASTDGSNILDLGAGPSGAGTRRTDLVILEVWQRLLSASPITDGKSPLGRIWCDGNVKIDASLDATLNYIDDILDAGVGLESTKRVQTQYRLRVVQDVDLFAYPYGLDDSAVVASSVPVTPAAPDGVSTAFTYTNQSAVQQPGLWRAGDGDPANALNTVDGYMYAIPVCAVFRRNTTAFDRNTNQNGGVVSPGPSDRPDGLFCDIVDADSVVDLRHGVSPGWDFTEVLEKNFHLLLDNNLRSEWATTTIGGGVSGHTVLWADEIGFLPGDGIITGDTPGAEFIGQFDAARRVFSDRSIYETMVVRVDPPGGTWTPGDVATIDFTSLNIYPYGPLNWAAYNDPRVLALDVLQAQWVGAAGAYTGDALPFIASITGLTNMPVTSLDVTLGSSIPGGLTTSPLYVTLLVAYPSGLGLTRTPTDDFAGSITVNNPAQLPGVAPVNYQSMYVGNGVDSPHREVRLQYNTLNLAITMAADSAGVSSTFNLPERAGAIVSVLRNAVPISGGALLDAAGRTCTFTSPLDYTNPGDSLTVTYTAVRPLPQNGEQLTIWYYARAPQTARTALLGTTLTLTPRVVGKAIFSLTTGSGSPDEGYPFPVAYTQLGGVYLTSLGSFTGDHELSALGAMSVSEFNAETGQLHLPTFIPPVPEAQSLTLNRDPGDVDIEGRSFFKSVPVGYVPNAYSQGLSDAKRHRNALPILAELSSDSDLGRKGQIVLVVLNREAIFDSENFVAFDDDLAQNTTTASVFRVKGTLLNR